MTTGPRFFLIQEDGMYIVIDGLTGNAVPMGRYKFKADATWRADRENEGNR